MRYDLENLKLELIDKMKKGERKTTDNINGSSAVKLLNFKVIPAEFWHLEAVAMATERQLRELA